MDADEPRKRPSTHEIGMVLDTMSVGELRERIEMLEAEIARLRSALDARQQSRMAADAFFKR